MINFPLSRDILKKSDARKHVQILIKHGIRVRPFLLVVGLGVLAAPFAPADESVPQVSAVSYAASNLNLTISNVGTGGTYYVERETDLISTNWPTVYSFEGSAGSTNWSDGAVGSAMSSFYRVIRDPYHSKVGETAVLNGTSHMVSGTTHILNNRTIELRNFNFDGGGVVVQVYISPNATINPYIAISEDLVGPPFENETLTLDIPEETDLDSISYISIWCVAASFSFGDGQFQ